MPIPEIGSQLPIEIIVGRHTLQAISEIAPEHSLSVQILTPEGNFYKHTPANLCEDQSYIRIYRSDRHDLTEFWHQVGELSSELRKRQNQG